MVALRNYRRATTYAEAAALWETRSKWADRIKVAYGTYLERGLDCYVIRFRAIDIVVFHKSGAITLSADGCVTPQLAMRLSLYTPGGIRVVCRGSRHRGHYVVSLGDKQPERWSGNDPYYFYPDEV